MNIGVKSRQGEGVQISEYFSDVIQVWPLVLILSKCRMTASSLVVLNPIEHYCHLQPLSEDEDDCLSLLITFQRQRSIVELVMSSRLPDGKI